MDTVDAGRGVVSVSVRAAGQDVKHSVRQIDDGCYEVTFHPKLAVPHRVDVKYNGLHISGEPFLQSWKFQTSINFSQIYITLLIDINNFSNFVLSLVCAQDSLLLQFATF